MSPGKLQLLASVKMHPGHCLGNQAELVCCHLGCFQCPGGQPWDFLVLSYSSPGKVILLGISAISHGHLGLKVNTCPLNQPQRATE